MNVTNREKKLSLNRLRNNRIYITHALRIKIKGPTLLSINLTRNLPLFEDSPDQTKTTRTSRNQT